MKENGLDEQYINLLKDILENGVEKETRNGKVLSVFGRTIRFKFNGNNFPLLTTKKMYFKGIVTELLWFLRGDTNIKYLVDNDCHIWDGDAWKAYEKKALDVIGENEKDKLLSKEELINKIKTDDEFAKKCGDLGPVYGKQWRRWNGQVDDISGIGCYHDQIANAIHLLKTDPDSRRNRVSAWNVSDLDQMTLPPCHTDFQFYTRELSLDERQGTYTVWTEDSYGVDGKLRSPLTIDWERTPKRAISLMFNMRSNDVPLGLPFNIASYALLLEIIGKMVNMVPDELIGNLGDCHIYLNQIEGCEEQIGRYLEVDERVCMCYENPKLDLSRIQEGMSDSEFTKVCDEFGIPTRTREPFELPKLVFGKTDEFFKSLSDDLSLITHLDNTDFNVENYQSHPTIKFPLSN